MGWLIGLLVVLLFGSVLYAALLHADIRRITRELRYIDEHDTNATVTTATNLPAIRDLAQTINHSQVVVARWRQAQLTQETKVHQMLTNLTHDIKTPLTVAMGYVQLLAKTAVPADQAAFTRTTNNLTSVNYYLHYLMDFNLIQEKSAALSLQQVDVSALVEQDLLDFYDELTAKGLLVTPAITPGLVLTTDETMLHRIMQNLLGNWVKYAARTATLTLTRQDDTHVALTFTNETDQPAAATAELVARYYTMDQNTAQHRSNGLGLSIVNGLVTTLGGRMALTSQPGTFTITLTFRQ